jgi:hypothetical protein
VIGTFERLKELLLENTSFTQKEREIVNFLTFGNRWDISVLFYGISEETLSFVKKEFGKDFSFLLREEILSRINFVTIANSKDSLDSKLLVNFNKKESYTEEEKELLVKLFSFYGNYDEVFIRAYLESGKFLPSVVVNRVQELEAEVLIVERLAVLGSIESLLLTFPTVSNENFTTKRISFVFIDEDKDWPNALNPMDYQLHILSTVNDFTIYHFFKNLNLICERLVDTLNIERKLLLRLLTQIGFFSFVEKKKVSENSRVLTELEIESFPNRFESFLNKYNPTNFILTSALFINVSELNYLFQNYANLILNKLGSQLFVDFCNINFSKLDFLSKKFLMLENIKKEYEDIINVFKKLKQISGQLDSLKNRNLDENFVGRLLSLLEEVKTVEKFFDKSNSLSEIKEVQAQLEEKLSDKRNLISSIITGFKELPLTNDIIEKVSNLLSMMFRELSCKEEIITLNLKFLTLIFHELSLLDEKSSRNILALLEKELLKDGNEKNFSVSEGTANLEVKESKE